MMSTEELQSELSNSKYSSLCTVPNTPRSQSECQILRGGSVTLEDCKIPPKPSEDENDTDCRNTITPLIVVTPERNEESLGRGNQMDIGNNSQRLAVNRIQEVFTKGLASLDLSSTQLTEVPESIFTLHNIMYLYLANNQITFLPDGLFEHFPLLRWCDLRHNCLTCLPSISDDGHDELRCLLIEGNTIRRLPLQLGFMSKLHGLNIHNNPIEFPPSHIIKEGTQKILQFLHDTFIKQNQENNPQNDQKDAASELKRKTLKKKYKDSKRNSGNRGEHEHTFDRITLKAREDSRMSALRKSYMNTDRLLQLKKDRDSLKKFQDGCRQRQKHETIEASDVVATAPFGICPDHMKILSQEDIKRTPEKREPLPDVHKSKRKPLKSRALCIEELEEKIRNHYIKMHERRKQTHNSFADEVHAMKEDLDKAKYLQNELEVHRQNLEYRFQAFTPDIRITSASKLH